MDRRTCRQCHHKWYAPGRGSSPALGRLLPLPELFLDAEGLVQAGIDQHQRGQGGQPEIGQRQQADREGEKPKGHQDIRQENGHRPRRPGQLGNEQQGGVFDEPAQGQLHQRQLGPQVQRHAQQEQHPQHQRQAGGQIHLERPGVEQQKNLGAQQSPAQRPRQQRRPGAAPPGRAVGAPPDPARVVPQPPQQGVRQGAQLRPGNGAPHQARQGGKQHRMGGHGKKHARDEGQAANQRQKARPEVIPEIPGRQLPQAGKAGLAGDVLPAPGLLLVKPWEQTHRRRAPSCQPPKSCPKSPPGHAARPFSILLKT